MPAGQTPHTTFVYAHNDLVDKVQPGDRVNITGERPTPTTAVAIPEKAAHSPTLPKCPPQASTGPSPCA